MMVNSAEGTFTVKECFTIVKEKLFMMESGEEAK
jgi:hypothetical protein